MLGSRMVWSPDDSTLIIENYRMALPAEGQTGTFQPFTLHGYNVRVMSMTAMASNNLALAEWNDELILLPILPDGLTFRLGLAGGPLIVALILGKLGRTGPLVWNLPYSANLTIRQIGLILFLAGVGTRSGYAFVETVFSRSGLTLFVTGAIITTLVALLTLIIGYKLLRIPMGLLTGLLAGLQTQPAVLGFALEQSENELPNIGYATVYPLATIGKILIAQFILAFVGR